MKNYTSFACNRQMNRGGGSMIQIRDNISYIQEIKCSLPETKAILVKYANVRIILVVTYLKPRSDKGLFIEKLDEFLEKLSNHNGPIIFGGDFNIDILQQSNLVNNYLNTIAANGFILTSDTPTRITAESNTCIDHFFVKKYSGI